MNNTKQLKHLYARAGFGLRYTDEAFLRERIIRHTVKQLLKVPATGTAISILKESPDYAMLTKGDALAKKMFLQDQRQQEKDLNIAWMNQMSATEAPLQEKMTLFWHNHFACRTNNPLFAQQLNNIHRVNALGNFRTLLLQVAESPAMLQFLNNQQNQKNHPNENFARELMELFTIGRGNYTETDVKESARAFTGYGFNKTGEFVTRKFQHDDGLKTFMGNTGTFTGTDIMDALLERKETALFISNKIYRYLVNETPDPLQVKAMADIFYNSGYEISPLLEYIFTADWFYDDKNTGGMIKSPVEFLVGLNRQFYIGYQKPEVMLQFQRVLGQVLFYPPNVAGWPGGRNWIDSSSLMYRLKIPSTLLNGGLIDFKGKADPEDEAYIAATRNQQPFVNTHVQTVPGWDKFLQSIPRHSTNTDIAAFMLEPKLNQKLLDKVNGAADMKSLVIELVSTPEYQLC